MERSSGSRRMISEKKKNTGIFEKFDYVIFFCTMALVLFGIIMVFSASYYIAGTDANYGYDSYFFLKRNIAFAILGFCGMIFFMFIDYNSLKKWSRAIYAIAIILLILVLIAGKTVNGAKRWLEIGGFSLQPGEIAKFAVIMTLSSFISKRKDILKTLGGLGMCVLVMLVPIILVGIENLSTAIIIGIIGVMIILVATPNFKREFTILSVTGITGVIFTIAAGAAFRMERIKVWLDPFSADKDSAFQTIQSLYAIASGGMFGLGLGQSRQKLGFIPEAQNDIIFAVMCEELGIIGAVILVLLFGIFIWRGYTIAMKADTRYGCYVATGITTMVATQCVVNMSVVTNTIPNTGVPLPFISYGGTALFVIMSLVGILINISKNDKNGISNEE
ncbi:MAG: cell division protein FtsW [Firmicutes bacterium]|nr:cell division protein FtsW [Bacillota bacterium]